MQRIKYFLSFILVAVLFTGCASLRKAELASGDDPERAVKEVTKIMLRSQKSQFDVLADEEYAQGEEYLAKANKALKRGQKELVLENASIAKAFFEDADKVATGRQDKARRILEAREAALDAGARNSTSMIEMLSKIDTGLKNETDRFDKQLEPEEFSTFQKKYLALETKAVQYREIGGAKQAIAKAINDDAGDLAPQTLKTAQLDYTSAENIIAQSPRSPGIYGKYTKTALRSATQLSDVMNVILNAKGTPEKIAVQIVNQKRALGELTTSIGKLETSLESTKMSLQEKESVLQKREKELEHTESVLKSQEQQLELASTQVRFQQAMDEARKVLPQEDALVYQQGNKLVFRMKRINFPSGKAVIPASSKPLLAKVNTIIKTLNADKVIVQGHTDSVGSASVNKKLSKERAHAVASYMASLRGGYKLTYQGYGESSPIASNETAEGRATNRRVDLVVSVEQ